MLQTEHSWHRFPSQKEWPSRLGRQPVSAAEASLWLPLQEPCSALHASLAADQLTLTLLTMHGVLPLSLATASCHPLSMVALPVCIRLPDGKEPHQGPLLRIQTGAGQAVD